MFARHTQARRMKRTGVTQGLKSLVDKLHPNGNAPLTSGEAKRLLTALTSSFRRHLDEAHPTAIADDGKLRAERQSQRTPLVTASSIHSSAAFAQRHMASVLTNPLLVKGVNTHAAAKTEIAAHKDPIALLEKYDREGVATVHFAELCLDAVRKNYDSVPTERRTQLLEEFRPGRRVFDWLFRSGLCASYTFADNVRFIDHLVFFLVHEGQQEQIWQWLQMHIKTPPGPGPEVAHVKKHDSTRYLYRWRGRVLPAFIQHTVGVTRQPIPNKTQILCASKLHQGLDILFGFAKLRQPTPKEGLIKDYHHLTWISLGGSIAFLVKLLTRRLIPPSRVGDVRLVDGDQIDPVRFDRLIEFTRTTINTIDSFPADYTAVLSKAHRPMDPAGNPKQGVITKAQLAMDPATLLMMHPRTPSAECMLEVLQQFLPDERANSDRECVAWLNRNSIYWADKITRCASLLAKQGKHNDAAWVRARLPLYLPHVDFKFQGAEGRKTAIHRANSGTSDGPTRVPFPSFA